jgi:hypothetical protein
MDSNRKGSRSAITRWVLPRTRGLTLAAVAAVLGLMKAETLYGQRGCTSTKAIVCGGEVVCTTDPGSNCVTCTDQ